MMRRSSLVKSNCRPCALVEAYFVVWIVEVRKTSVTPDGFGCERGAVKGAFMVELRLGQSFKTPLHIEKTTLRKSIISFKICV
ncbi:hypothetical protein JTE90_029488 [Oedothorax gibbosus]|uniref:Uncharacterized protein n=1 Tax=Oedothorax gibbosus TaxID=931172 RepID=A0AAV6V4R3_9ARAC|nr:hypothetical protein JTE90_029488 [Oedothorax gibbosus]